MNAKKRSGVYHRTTVDIARSTCTTISRTHTHTHTPARSKHTVKFVRGQTIRRLQCVPISPAEVPSIVPPFKTLILDSWRPVRFMILFVVANPSIPKGEVLLWRLRRHPIHY